MSLGTTSRRAARGKRLQSFNAIFRTICLNRWLFASLTEAEVVIHQWLDKYNTVSPHGALQAVHRCSSSSSGCRAMRINHLSP
jgi:transposase InsO family protein